MSKKIVALNAGPGKGWNTDTLINEAIKGAHQRQHFAAEGLFKNRLGMDAF